jgi:hypothetical protein
MSSPTSRLRLVISTTTIPRASVLAYALIAAQRCSNAASGVESAGPPTAPNKTLTSVIPICTVERKVVGFCASFRAAAALLLPSLANCCKRAFREETTAISDITNMPLIRSKRKRIKTSRMIPDIN